MTAIAAIVIFGMLGLVSGAALGWAGRPRNDAQQRHTQQLIGAADQGQDRWDECELVAPVVKSKNGEEPKEEERHDKRPQFSQHGVYCSLVGEPAGRK